MVSLFYFINNHFSFSIASSFCNSVARAAYSDKDIIILDDPMSALDPEVGHRLFDQCIRKVLKKKTVILVTHSMDILIDVDRVLVLDVKTIDSNGQVVVVETKSDGDQVETTTDANGADDGLVVTNLIGYVREEGTFNELLSAGLDFAKMLGKGKEENAMEEDTTDPNNESTTSPNDIELSVGADNTTTTANQHAEKSRANSASRSPKTSTMKKLRTQSVDSVGSVGSDGSNRPKQAKALMDKEEREKGAVNGKVYWAYVQAGGGACRFALILFW